MLRQLARWGADVSQFLRIMRLAGDLKRAQGLRPEGLQRLQDSRLRALLSFARERSVFYRERLAGFDLERVSLQALPTLTKDDLRQRFADIITDPQVRESEVKAYLEDDATVGHLFRGRYLVAYSSGTTGNKTYCVHDREAVEALIASMFVRQVLPRRPSARVQRELLLRALLRGERHRMALVVVPGHVASNTLAHAAPRFHDLFVERRILSSTESIGAIVERLNAFDPQTLMTYATLLEELAHEKLAGRLRIALDSPVSALYSGGEPLTQRAREVVRRAWGLEVNDAYQMSECLLVARNDADFDGLYLMSDFCVLEAVDEHNRPAAHADAIHKVLITNLLNRVQPIIRYEVTDLTGYALEPPKPSWPFPKLLPVQGRTNDLFHVPDGRGGIERMVPYRFGFMFAMDGLRQFQFVQTAPDRATFYFVPVPERADQIEREVHATVRKHMRDLGLEGRLHVTLERVQALERQVGKLRQFKSLVAPIGHAG